MASIVAKRRRVEDEVRPKKKIRKVKKQKAYHSSSEDEDEVVMTDVTQKATDAPRPQPKYTMKGNVSMIDPAFASAKALTSNPKSILKQSSPSQKPAKSAAGNNTVNSKADLDELETNTALNALQADGDDSEEGTHNGDKLGLESNDASEDEDSIESDSEASTTPGQSSRAKRKRNDPAAFATSISKILDTKLTTAKRQDPVLSRSKSAADANKTLADEKLEHKLRAQLRAEKRMISEKGRVKDILGLETPDVDTGAIVEEEKKLKKTAQRGVVKLFNAVRAAQVKAEDAMKQARSEGVVGMQKREERVNEMSKQGFLDLISSGGKPVSAASL